MNVEADKPESEMPRKARILRRFVILGVLCALIGTAAALLYAASGSDAVLTGSTASDLLTPSDPVTQIIDVPQDAQKITLNSRGDSTQETCRTAPVTIRVTTGGREVYRDTFPATSSNTAIIPIRSSPSRITVNFSLAGSGACSTHLSFTPTLSWRDRSIPAWPVITVSLGLLIAATSTRLHQRSLESRSLDLIDRVREAEEGLERNLRHREPQSDEDGFESSLVLSNLWEVTHARLTLYHNIAQGQATRSFRNAQLAMGIGFLTLVAFAVIAIRSTTTAGTVVAGTLGTVAAALSGYVSRTFVKSQRDSATHLRTYFDQPLEFSRYLAAERLIRDAPLSDEARAALLADVVRAMVAKPEPAAPIPDTPEEDSKPGGAK